MIPPEELLSPPSGRDGVFWQQHSSSQVRVDPPGVQGEGGARGQEGVGGAGAALCKSWCQFCWLVGRFVVGSDMVGGSSAATREDKGEEDESRDIDEGISLDHPGNR